MGFWSSILLFLVSLLTWGCQTVYYDTMERMGIHKREILVDRVTEAQESQEVAKEQFADALEAFRATVTVEGSKLQETYDRLQKEYDLSVRRANDVRGRIAAVKNVAEALFDEWETELADFSSDKYRESSQAQLTQTRKEYEKLLTAMNKAEEKMNPILVVFNDQVLFLKHNLNARAIASIQSEVTAMEEEVADLIQDMNAAIAEAEAFVKQLKE
ncbi:MAG: DUF2959 domain-containing protein [Verrucomicrobia bacterium]|nr:DUF2959 domain-containing protein [Verrucomicrobiota bacterium]MDA1067744.1 DUF2959 domain-containing protein [Verrucomicrobiota bacterium]